jgi:arginase family enzyme
VERQLVALVCRTSDRVPGGAAGTRELAELLDARIVGSPGEPRSGSWSDDLRDSRGCLLEAGGQLDDALEAGRVPILLAPECSIAISTLPALIRRHPDARVLWLDAHADFHTPATTRSGYLGGMCLAGACGLWDTGFGAGVDPPRVIMHGVRDVEGGERVALDRGGVHLVEDPAQLDRFEVFVHLDLDVLDPSGFPAQFPADNGLTPAELRAFLADACAACTILGAEITSAAPGHGQLVVDAIAPLLGSP